MVIKSHEKNFTLDSENHEFGDSYYQGEFKEDE